MPLPTIVKIPDLNPKDDIQRKMVAPAMVPGAMSVGSKLSDRGSALLTFLKVGSDFLIKFLLNAGMEDVDFDIGWGLLILGITHQLPVGFVYGRYYMRF